MTKQNKDDDGSLADDLPDLYEEDGKKKSRATILIEIGEKMTLFHDCNGETYAEIKTTLSREKWPIKSKRYKEYIANKYYQLTGNGVDRASINDATATLSAKARFDGKQRDVFLRVASIDDKIYIDLCDEKWRVVEITADGWKVLDDSPVVFLRNRGMAPLCEPSKNGNISCLWKYLNIDEAHQPLVTAFLVAALRQQAPYPIMVLLGEQGTAKSTVARILRSLIDPSHVPLRAPPKDARDFLVGAVNNWCITLDNLSGMQPWLSDCMCRLATGGGYSSRELYSDHDETLIEVERPSIVNGIDDVATRPDFAERSILLHLLPIPEEMRTSERKLWSGFEKCRPEILGAILDMLVCATRNIHSVNIKRLPRMGDFVEWAVAAENGADKFLYLYNENQKNIVLAGLESSPVGKSVMALMDSSTNWTGSMSDLHNRLTDFIDEDTRRSKAWPKSSNWLSNSLRRLGSPLRKIGIDVSHNENDRKVTINKFSTKPENSRNCRIAVANDTAKQQKQQKSEDVENNLRPSDRESNARNWRSRVTSI